MNYSLLPQFRRTDWLSGWLVGPVLLLLLFCLLIPAMVRAQGPADETPPPADNIRYVSTTGTQPASGATSWAQSTTDLQGAINAVAPFEDGTVYVALGVYQPGGPTNTNPTVSFTIASGVTVLGGYTGIGTPGPRTAFPSSTTLSGLLTGGNRSYHVVQFFNADVTTTLDGFVITGGRANGSTPDNQGGGIYNLAQENISSSTLRNLIITANQAQTGGGIANDARSNGVASPALTTVLLSQNTATSGNGGGMFNNGSSTGNISSPVLKSVTLTANLAGNNGGAIYNEAANGGVSSPVLTGVVLSQNTVTTGYGGAICNNANGAGSISSPVLTNVTLTANRATTGGGAIYNFANISGSSSSPTLMGVLLSQNTTGRSGGAMYNLGSDGISSPVLQSVTLIGNQAEQGGALYSMALSSGTATVTLTDVLVSQNTATGSGFGQGGGGLGHETQGGTSRSVLTNVTLIDNQAQQGGAIFIRALSGGITSPALTNVLLSRNIAIGGSGGGIYSLGDGGISSPVLQSVTVTANRAAESGGGIYVQGGTSGAASFTLTDVLFTQNTALSPNSYQGGGALYYDTRSSSNPVLLRVTLTGNQARSGGAIYNQAQSGNGIVTTTATLTDVLFSQNTATGTGAPDGGGGFYNRGASGVSSPVFESVTLTGNQAQSGGAIYGRAEFGSNGRSNPTLRNVLFGDNVAFGTATGQGGGAIYSLGNGSDCSPALTSVTLIRNRAANQGGAIYNEGTSGPSGTASLTLTGVLLSQNTATINGGAISNLGNNSGTSSPVLNSVTITANSAANGGGIFNEARNSGVASPALTNVSFSQNTATNFGGAMYNSGNGSTSSPVLNSVTLTANLALFGGGIANDAQNSGVVSPALTNVSFSQNTATIVGGAMYNFGNGGTSTPVLTNVAFVNNRANNSGGGIYNNGTASATLINASFGFNSALTGSVLVNSNSPTSLINAVLFDNTGGAAFDGSGITVGYSLLQSTIPTNSYTNGGNNRFTTISPFVDGANGNLRLNTCAPAIDAGNNAANLTTTDLDGQPRRYQGDNIDMGAYEFQGDGKNPNGITQQPPSSSAVCAGSTVSIPLSVSGSLPFSAQLYRAGQLVASQPSQSSGSFSFTLNNVSSSSEGSYSVVVTGGCNSVTSTAFNLSVSESPANPLVVVSGPVGCANSSVTLTASANGANIYTLQPGNTSNSTGVFTVSTAGTYTVLAQNMASGCQSQTSVVVSESVKAEAGPITVSGPASCASPARLTAPATGQLFVFTGPNGYVYSNTYRNACAYTAFAEGIKVGGTYTLTVSGSAGCPSAMRTIVVQGPGSCP